MATRDVASHALIPVFADDPRERIMSLLMHEIGDPVEKDPKTFLVDLIQEQERAAKAFLYSLDASRRALEEKKEAAPLYYQPAVASYHRRLRVFISAGRSREGYSLEGLLPGGPAPGWPILAGEGRDERSREDPRSGDRSLHDLQHENQELEARVRFLEHQFRSARLDLQLYRLGAGGFLAGALSLALWTLTGVAAPFHPAFAGVVTPVSIVLMIMAFLVRGERQPRTNER